MNEASVSLRVVRLRPTARMPERASAGATGFDLYACLESPVYVDVGPDPVRIPTGIAIESPPGYDLQLRPRSGLSARGVMASFGTLDADYRGEVLVTLYTVGSRGSYRVQDGDRVAQLVVARLVDVIWQEHTSLEPTRRGAGGHGSTGR